MRGLPTRRRPARVKVRQVTRGPGGRILTNVGVWSPDGAWIVYDTRSDAAGEVFGGSRVEKVNVETGEVRVLHHAPPDAARAGATGLATGAASWWTARTGNGSKYPGLQGPRHWLRSSPDGSRIAFLMKDDAGIVQLWTVSPNGGPAAPLTRNPWPVASAFTWDPDGRRIAHVMDTSVCVTDAATGETTRLTAPTSEDVAPRPEACVFSPDGRRIACIRRVPSPTEPANQVCVLE